MNIKLVSDIETIADEVFIVQRVQHRVAQIELLHRGLSPRQIERKAKRAERLICGFRARIFLFQLAVVHLTVLHACHLLKKIYFSLCIKSLKVTNKSQILILMQSEQEVFDTKASKEIEEVPTSDHTKMGLTLVRCSSY